MTDLIQSQLKVIAVMAYCGLTRGLDNRRLPPFYKPIL